MLEEEIRPASVEDVQGTHPMSLARSALDRFITATRTTSISQCAKALGGKGPVRSWPSLRTYTFPDGSSLTTQGSGVTHTVRIETAGGGVTIYHTRKEKEFYRG